MTKLKMYWRTDDHLNAIKKKMRGLKESDYIVIIDPNDDLKTLRKLGFSVHRVKVNDIHYNEHGYFRHLHDTCATFKIIKFKTTEQLNFLKLSCPEAIKDIVKVGDIREWIGM